MIGEIRSFAGEHGLLWGVCLADKLEGPFEWALENGPVPFTTADVRARLEPAALLARAKSVIVLGLNYGKIQTCAMDGKPRGRVSAMAVGVDYHAVIAALLKRLADRLTAIKPFEYRLFVDDGPLVERALAHRAGLGFYGRNCCLIAPLEGSFFNIGIMLTTLDLPVSGEKPLSLDLCGDCRLCVDACPAGAIVFGDKPRCQAEKCVSYLTQKRGALTREQVRSLGRNVYGCDACQLVCPHNRHAPLAPVNDIELLNPELEPLADISDEDFAKRFGHTAAGWRGPEVMRRNACFALENIENANKSGRFWKK